MEAKVHYPVHKKSQTKPSCQDHTLSTTDDKPIFHPRP